MKPMLLTLCWVATMLAGCGGPLTITLGATNPRAPIVEHVVLAEKGFLLTDQVAVIQVSGLIQNAATSTLFGSSENPVGRLHESLEKARLNPAVKAIILRINSPGGTVTASDLMYREVVRFKTKSKKPVVAMIMDVGASGGYYVACGTDHIIAHPSSITGSIGVIMQTVSFAGVMSKIGIKADAITSGKNKNTGSPFKDLSDTDKQLLKVMVMDFYKQFVSIVRTNRPSIPAAQFATVTDGRVFTGNQALKLGLVDQLGDLYDAHAKAKQLAGLKAAHLVLYKRQGGFAGSAYARTNAPQTQVNLAQFNLGNGTIGPNDGTGTFLYLWQPGRP
jgi:protease-4